MSSEKGYTGSAHFAKVVKVFSSSADILHWDMETDEPYIDADTSASMKPICVRVSELFAPPPQVRTSFSCTCPS